GHWPFRTASLKVPPQEGHLPWPVAFSSACIPIRLRALEEDRRRDYRKNSFIRNCRLCVSTYEPTTENKYFISSSRSSALVTVCASSSRIDSRYLWRKRCTATPTALEDIPSFGPKES